MKTAYSHKIATADVLGLRRRLRTDGAGASPEIVVRPEPLPPAGAFARLKPYLPGILLAVAVIVLPWLAHRLAG